MKQLTSEQTVVKDSEHAVELFFEKGWTDGMAVVPPTDDKILQFLDYAGLEPDIVLGNISQRDRVITAEKVAINAVMAGCKAEYMPVVMAAVEAVCDPDFNINHLASLGSPWPLLIVNGPIAVELGIRSGAYLLGPDGSRASSTIARAISLLLWNCAEAKPQGIQAGQFGNPGRWHYCVSENETTPWEPLHVQLGFDRQTSTVTAISVMPGPRRVFIYRKEPEQMMDAMCEAIAHYYFDKRGTYILFVPPPMVEMFTKHNWTKRNVRDYIVENTKRSVASFKRSGDWDARKASADSSAVKTNPGDEKRFVYLFKPGEYDDHVFQTSHDQIKKRVDDIFVVVAGGNTGTQICFLAPYGTPNPITKAVRAPVAESEVTRSRSSSEPESGIVLGKRRGMIGVRNPTADPATGTVVLAPRLSTLAGKVLGVLWNGQPFGDQVLKLVAEELQRKYGLKSMAFTRKPSADTIAPKETFDGLAANSDAVIIGVGESGKNCTVAVLDALTMEKRGIPAVCIGVETLVMTAGRGMAMAHGVHDYPIAGFRHKLVQEEIGELVAEVIPQVIKALCV